MKNTKNTSRSRTPLAITLIAASFLSAFLLATFSHQGEDFWVAAIDLPAGHQVVSGAKHYQEGLSELLYE